MNLLQTGFEAKKNYPNRILKTIEHVPSYSGGSDDLMTLNLNNGIEFDTSYNICVEMKTKWTQSCPSTNTFSCKRFCKNVVVSDGIPVGKPRITKFSSIQDDEITFLVIDPPSPNARKIKKFCI